MLDPLTAGMSVDEFLRWENGTDTRYARRPSIACKRLPIAGGLKSVQEILLIDSETIFAEILRREGNRWITEIAGTFGCIIPRVGAAEHRDGRTL